jgi:DivIVA domain-containing protein
MPLTPEDVSQKRFTPVRLREGYDMGEVDMFLDEVEGELGRLYKENEDLRNKLQAAQQGLPVVVEAPVVEAAPEPEPVAEVAPPVPEPVVAAPIEKIQVTTVADASSAAARLLEIATRNAEELEISAKSDADKIIGAARTTAERLESESKEKADRLESDARSRAAMLDSETAERRAQLFGELEREKDKLSAEVENLRTFEREYRSRLKSYFRQQLDSLEQGTEAEAAGDPEPKRMKFLLAEDDEA